MLMWLLTLAIIFICYFLSLKTKKPRKFFFISVGIAMVLILGSRYFINGFTDEISYNYLYQRFSTTPFSRLIETNWSERDFLFYLVYWAMAHIIPWAQFPIYFITAAFVAVTFRFAYKNTNGTVIPVLLMLAFGTFSFHMAAYRQCFAMCLCILAYEFAKKKGLGGFIPYAILVTLAAFTHVSAIIFIPVYFLVRIKPDAKGGVLWFLSLVALLLAANSIMTFAAELLEEDGMLDTLEFSPTGLIIQVIIMAVPLIIALLRLDSYTSGKRIQHALLVLMSMGIMFLTFKFLYFTYERVSYYYSFFVIGAFSNAITNLNEKKGERSFVLPVQIVVVLLLAALSLWRVPTDLVFFWQA